MSDNNIEKSFKNGKSRAEKMLGDIEMHLINLINDKKEVRRKFLAKLKEVDRQNKQNQEKFLAKLKEVDRQNKQNQEWFENEWKEAERIENKLILLWDYWQRELEIMDLQKKLQLSIVPTERERLMKEVKRLNDFNVTIEKGFKQRKINAEIVEKLKKKLGVWEED